MSPLTSKKKRRKRKKGGVQDRTKRIRLAEKRHQRELRKKRSQRGSLEERYDRELTVAKEEANR